MVWEPIADKDTQTDTHVNFMIQDTLQGLINGELLIVGGGVLRPDLEVNLIGGEIRSKMSVLDVKNDADNKI